MDTNTRVESKISILNDTLIKIFGADLNKARIKFIGLFFIALSKVQTVNFEKIAVAFENDAKTFSSLRRIQRFIAEYILDTNMRPLQNYLKYKILTFLTSSFVVVEKFQSSLTIG
jgi:hypothetical protein